MNPILKAQQESEEETNKDLSLWVHEIYSWNRELTEEEKQSILSAGQPVTYEEILKTLTVKPPLLSRGGIIINPK